MNTYTIVIHYMMTEYFLWINFLFITIGAFDDMFHGFLDIELTEEKVFDYLSSAKNHVCAFRLNKNLKIWMKCELILFKLCRKLKVNFLFSFFKLQKLVWKVD